MFHWIQKKKLQSEGHSLSRIDRLLVEAFGRQVFCSGFVHADPHPGNLLIRYAGNPTNCSLLSRLWAPKRQTQLVILDHGLYQRITQQQRLALCQVYKSIFSNDEANMQKASTELNIDG